MKKLSMEKVIYTVRTRRNLKGLTQQVLADRCGMNRTMIGHLENSKYIPSIIQLQTIAEVLDFDITDMFIENYDSMSDCENNHNITFISTDDRCLPLAEKLSSSNSVSITGIPENQISKDSPVKWIDYSESALAYENSDAIFINFHAEMNENSESYDCSHIDAEIENIIQINSKALILISSSVPIGYTSSVKKKYNIEHIAFIPEFVNEVDYNVRTSDIPMIIGCDDMSAEACLATAARYLRFEQKNIMPLSISFNEAEAVNIFLNSNRIQLQHNLTETKRFALVNDIDYANFADGVILGSKAFLLK